MATRQQVIDTIRAVAARLGVDPNLAVATATQESGLNPNAVGDNGTSFGLFQLHRGGELGNLSPSQAFDPATNATVSLTEIAKVARAHPDYTPGQVAAAAQRPDDQAGYARRVDALYAQITNGQVPGGTSASSGSAPSTTASNVGLFSGADWRKLGLEIVFVIGGLALVTTGLVTTFSSQLKGAGKALAGVIP